MSPTRFHCATSLLFWDVPSNATDSCDENGNFVVEGQLLMSRSARVALIDDEGNVVNSQSEDITTYHPIADHYEQSSEQIWGKVCKLIKKVTRKSPIDGEAATEFQRRIKGIGFAATCSLVALDENDKPVSLSVTGEDSQNIIMWMDHRAREEADSINATGHELLKYVGGKVSLEHQIPKLLWIKKNMPEAWSRTKKFFDLADYLTYKASHDDTRSICTLVCKWNFAGHQFTKEGGRGWDDSYFQQIGLNDFVDEHYVRIGGSKIRNVGDRLGRGLCKEASERMSIPTGIPISTGVIDAHAGGIGLLGTIIEGDAPSAQASSRVRGRMAVISGTSTCHMIVTDQAKFVPGVWGPYFSAMIPDMWLLEGGQSATGGLIDFIVKNHSAYNQLDEISKKSQYSPLEVLTHRLHRMAVTQKIELDRLTSDLHVLPYFHGNRSPRADPTLTGAICGLKMRGSVDDLAVLYLAVLQSIAYGTRHIIEEMSSKDVHIDTLLMTGGATKSELVIGQHANVTGVRIVTCRGDAVLGGAAILAASASKLFDNLPQCMQKLNRFHRLVKPDESVRGYHEAKYRVFLKMYEDQMSYRTIMSQN
ncbi:putative carbohydrate kinase [Planoprotostelium fungivorum]|uniref:Putative carbohydrate kinase n=1 Tax=Planoprotostelium fungivorum TaxID=1890364 RepID=A0A2P6MQY9_9EUKA|nr:putative carbohydrate kinase [Planoprotostelium fungivorum]